MIAPDGRPHRRAVQHTRRRTSARGIACFAFASVLCVTRAFAAGDPEPAAVDGSERAAIVAVASSLRFAWPELVAGLPGPAPRTTFGASDTLALQILAGAPFELLVAADAGAIEKVIEGGRARADDAVRYADGLLALAVRRAALPDAVPDGRTPDMDALRDALEGTPDARIAIANPDTAPYGRAAIEALASAGLDALDRARIVRGENASQALQFVRSGTVPAALVPWSLVEALDDPSLSVAPVSPERYARLEHRLVPIDGAGPAARALATHLLSDEAAAVLGRHGFRAEPAN